MRIVLFFLLVLGYLNQSFSQSLNVVWENTFGSPYDDGAYAMDLTDDGGAIIAGYAISNIFIVKVDSQGNSQWTKGFGGLHFENAFGIQQTNDSGYIFVGHSASSDGDLTLNQGSWDCWIVKLDQMGNIQWQRSLGGSDWDIAKSVQQTVDGGFVMLGSSYSSDGHVTSNHGGEDYWILKISHLGIIEWEKSLGGTLYESGNAVRQTLDNGYILVGSASSSDGDLTSNFGYEDYWVVKLDSAGNIEWQQSYGGSSSDFAHDVILTKDSGYMVVGTSWSRDLQVTRSKGEADYWAVKLSNTGTIEWQKSYGGTSKDKARSVYQTMDGGYVIAGYSESDDGDVSGHHGQFLNYDAWIVRIDSIGNLIWQKSLGGSHNDHAQSIVQTNDGAYIFAGSSGSSDGDVNNNFGFDDLWIVKLGTNTNIISNDINKKITVYPNPSKGTFNFNIPNIDGIIEIYDPLGRTIYQLPIEDSKLVVNLENKNNGTYFYRILPSNGNPIYGKIIKQ